MLKKFVNDPASSIEEMLEGFVETFPHFYEKHPEVNSILYRKKRENRVALVTGGGSGHEPLFIGFVGKGLADAAVCGNLYTAPDPESIYLTAKAVEAGKGVLFLYGTYPGDRMNFDIAEERLRAEGIQTGHICVHDDVISAPSSRKSERRGIAGDVFLLRITGAACDMGCNMDDILAIAQQANDRLWSIGAAMTQQWVSQSGERAGTFHTGEYIEYGVGLHGERGILRTEAQQVDQLVNQMYSQILSEAEIKKQDEVCVLVNGLGSISLMELWIAFRRLKKLLDDDGIILYDADVNNYCSSYESNGFSISLFKINEPLKKYYRASCYSPYYSHKCEKRKEVRLSSNMRISAAEQCRKDKSVRKYVPAERPESCLRQLDVRLLRDMMIHVADRLISAEQELSELDRVIGDGDHGICIANGMRKAKQRLMDLSEKNTPSEVYQLIGRTMMLFAGGASGTFFGGMYMAAAESAKGKEQLTVRDFSEMWEAALQSIEKKGGAQPGEKTLIDALVPAVNALQQCTDQTFEQALQAAECAAKEGMLETKHMIARYGRGKFLSDRAQGCQDAGATTIWLTFCGMHEYICGGV